MLLEPVECPDSQILTLGGIDTLSIPRGSSRSDVALLPQLLAPLSSLSEQRPADVSFLFGDAVPWVTGSHGYSCFNGGIVISRPSEAMRSEVKASR